MRVITKSCHEDYQLGEEYELTGKLLKSRLAGGLVLPADQFTYQYVSAPRGGTGDQQHLFTRIAPDPDAEVAPAPNSLPDESRLMEFAPDPTTNAPDAPQTRTEG